MNLTDSQWVAVMLIIGLVVVYLVVYLCKHFPPEIIANMAN
jgi:hypothetical protein